MNNADSNAAAAAKLTEFLESEKGEALLSSLVYELDDAADILNEGGADWVSGLIADYDGDHVEENVLSRIEDTADQFESAAYYLRNFIAEYFEQRGAIKAASSAIEAFAAAPTEANRLALVNASEILCGYRIPMPRSLKGKLRPFMPSRMTYSRIDFGSLNSISKHHLKVKVSAREAA